MPYEPTRGVYRYIDEETNFPHQTSGHRAKQVIPRRDIIAAELAQREAEARARQRNLRSNTRIPTNAHPLVRGRPDAEEEELYGDEDVYTQPAPRSAVRWPPGGTHGVDINYSSPPPAPRQKHAIPPRRSAQAPQQEVYIDDRGYEATERPKPKIRVNPLVWLGLGMIVMVFLWAGYSNALNWWQIHQDDTTFGRPRTFQIDAVVGHNDSASNPSHFEAINLNRHIIVIELPGGDATKARIYPVTTLFGDGQDLTPVTLSFKDVNGDGLLDMEIHIENQTLVMINEAGSFRPLKAGEKVHL